MKRMVIFGEFDSDNLGDQLIGEGGVILFSNSGFSVQSLPFEPERKMAGTVSRENLKKASFFKKYHRFFYSRSYYYRHFLEALFYLKKWPMYGLYARECVDRADIVIIGGGQLFHDNTLRMLFRIRAIIKATASAEKEILVFGSGMSLPKTFISRLILKDILSGLTNSHLYLRDQYSVDIARLYSKIVSRNVSSIPDCAIAKAEKYALSSSTDLVLKIGVAPISISSLPFSDIHLAFNQDGWWTGLVEEIIKNGNEPVLFCSGVIADYERCIRIKDTLQARGLEIEIFPCPTNTEEFLAQLGQLSKLVCQRLHISISYYSMGGLPCSLVWDKKVESFYHQVGMSERLVNDTEISVTNMLKKILSENLPSVPPKEMTARLELSVRDIIGRLSSS